MADQEDIINALEFYSGLVTQYAGERIGVILKLDRDSGIAFDDVARWVKARVEAAKIELQGNISFDPTLQEIRVFGHQNIIEIAGEKGLGLSVAARALERPEIMPESKVEEVRAPVATEPPAAESPAADTAPKSPPRAAKQRSHSWEEIFEGAMAYQNGNQLLVVFKGGEPRNKLMEGTNSSNPLHIGNLCEATPIAWTVDNKPKLYGLLFHEEEIARLRNALENRNIPLSVGINVNFGDWVGLIAEIRAERAAITAPLEDPTAAIAAPVEIPAAQEESAAPSAAPQSPKVPERTPKPAPASAASSATEDKTAKAEQNGDHPPSDNRKLGKSAPTDRFLNAWSFLQPGYGDTSPVVRQLREARILDNEGKDTVSLFLPKGMNVDDAISAISFFSAARYQVPSAAGDIPAENRMINNLRTEMAQEVKPTRIPGYKEFRVQKALLREIYPDPKRPEDFHIPVVKRNAPTGSKFTLSPEETESFPLYQKPDDAAKPSTLGASRKRAAGVGAGEEPKPKRQYELSEKMRKDFLDTLSERAVIAPKESAFELILIVADYTKKQQYAKLVGELLATAQMSFDRYRQGVNIMTIPLTPEQADRMRGRGVADSEGSLTMQTIEERAQALSKQIQSGAVRTS